MEKKISYTSEERLLKLNECFLGFGADPLVNINLLVALCGELMGATCALYNSLCDDMLCSLCQWNTPLGYKSIDRAEGHLCTDVIKSTGLTTVVVRNLQDTSYALTDPNVGLYKLRTYIGKAVKFDNLNIGSLCVVFQEDIIPDDNEIRLMDIIASAIGVEEDRKRSQNAFKESEEKYRLMFANNPQPMWIFDCETLAFLEVNHAAVNHYGYSEKEFLSMTIKDIRTAEDVAELMKHVKPTNLEFKELGEFRHLKKNGEVIDVQIAWHSVVSNGRKARHVLINDITKSKRAEAMQREEHERLLKIAGQLPGVVYQLRLRPDGSLSFPYTSENVYDIYGFRQDELRDDASKAFAPLQPDVYNRTMDYIFASAKDLSRCQFEIPVRIGDGPLRTLFVNAVPQAEEDGSVLWHGFLSDITEHKRAEEDLLESRQITEKIINSIPARVFWKDRDLVYLGCNTNFAHDAGFDDPADIVGKDDYDMGWHDQAELYRNDDNEVIESANPKLLIEEVQTTPDGNTITLLTNKIPIRNQKGVIIGVLGTYMDITERKLAESQLLLKHDELQRLNSEKDKFFSIIAHDLRSPFNGFLGLTEILASDLAGMTTGEINKMVLAMKRSATNLFSLLGNLLEWSRMQRGLTAFAPSTFLLMPKISESMIIVNDAADKKGILVNYKIPAELTVFADQNMLAVILRNLVTNAVKFTPKGGIILISAKSIPGNFVEISVRDTGIGMSKALIDDLFRLDVNTGRKGTAGEYSTGLGLMICKDFIEKNGGKLFIESDEGKGSDFKFTVPMNAAKEK